MPLHRRRLVIAALVMAAAAVAVSYLLRDWGPLPRDFRLRDLTGGY